MKPAPRDTKQDSVPFSALGVMLERGLSNSFPPPDHNSQTSSALSAAGPHSGEQLVCTPTKTRSLSDSTPKLIPSPDIREAKSSKDDNHIHADPKTPRRPNFHQRGLSLQMPPREVFSTGLSVNRAPLSPPLHHPRGPYGSPSHQVLPRHSRGLDFARACTNLHHSTLAESSPDSSPTITQKGMMIPNQRRSAFTSGFDSHSMGSNAWSQHGDKMAATSSLGSIAMLDDESSSNSDDDIDPMDHDETDDMIISTPQAMKSNNASASTPFAPSTANPFGNSFAGGSAGFMNYQRARLRRHRSRKSSSSASMSGHSSLASPAPASPPNGKASESNGGYFAREVAMRNAGSRRESLSFHTNDLHISSGNDSGDEAGRPPPGTPGVVRRAVTRRGNLLPKTRAFGRIKDDLIAETHPLDADIRREAEVIRQVRESDGDMIRPSSSAGHSNSDTLTGMLGDDRMPADHPGGAKGLFGAFPPAFGSREFWNTFEPLPSNGTGTSPNDTNGNGSRQPGPPPLFPRGSAMSDDISMGPSSPSISASSRSASLFSSTSHSHSTSHHGNLSLALSLAQQTTPPNLTAVANPFDAPATNAHAHAASHSRATTPQPPNSLHFPPSAADGIRKASKRRRDDEFDGMSLKRRAVSPGLSVQNSPVLSQSPGSGGGGAGPLWGTAGGSAGAFGKRSREGSVVPGSGNGNGNGNGNGVMGTPGMGPKRVGLQGMTDTSDGLMKMSIE
ncbi:hypothetical protein P152DRAFT_452864 [Eremomyces bilateralis CBS 781.70]|uniref:Uncharacterized protein n=1 Tax=Eremomyces bilateralis CBS 781.70 TaxID=1392243 RepID=A0A6G1FRT3_9PEZI|nr:uncharacterized protein P152DRAFT_452864 [Eremomyces bilateralis CBS 781.70]KAF1808401.1 hypothetical protein P152DRAFT_452864 [Eremomyces bilateralis CBS 781.70]